MRELPLSCAIITYNEEKNIGECIESVLNLCDEIVVLDSHSTDATERIARGYRKVRFARHDFDGHVQQKNRAIEMTRGRWILSIDADERVTPELAGSIRKFIHENPDADGAKIMRLTYHMGRFIRHGGWRNARYRLIRRSRGWWGGENPHDTIFIEGGKTDTAGGAVLNGELIHYSFRDLSDQIDTINKFSSIVAFNRHGRGSRFSLLKMLYKPPVKFIEMYIVKRGFLDGIPGLVIAIASAFSAFLKVAKLYELQRAGLTRPSNLRPDYAVQKSDKKKRIKD
jgi:glycosyltransferase involved in cell wall biosynthesis